MVWFVVVWFWIAPLVIWMLGFVGMGTGLWCLWAACIVVVSGVSYRFGFYPSVWFCVVA